MSYPLVLFQLLNLGYGHKRVGKTEIPGTTVRDRQLASGRKRRPIELMIELFCTSYSDRYFLVKSRDRRPSDVCLNWVSMTRHMGQHDSTYSADLGRVNGSLEWGKFTQNLTSG